MNAKGDMSGISISAKAATQSHRPLASLIIVCYNQGNYLADAISTALGQTYDNVEIILVDDGSTDNTAEIAQGFPAVRYVRQKNSGLSAARNAGLQASHGKYVVFLDADDRLLPRALESGIRCFHEFPDSGFVFGKYQRIDSGGIPLATQRDLGIAGDYYWHLLHGNFIGMHATVMYSREALQSAGGFNTELRAAEDYDVYLRIARRWNVRQHGWLIAEYREHSTNMSGDRLVMLKSVLQVLRLESAHVPDRRHMRALRSGMTFCKHYYGNRLIDAWRKDMNVPGLLTLVRWYPSGLIRRTVKSLRNRVAPSAEPRSLRFGDLRRVSPFSRFGFERGKPIDRRYIESFLNDYAADIHGHVLEIGDDTYSRLFGGTRISQQDVLHICAGHPGATIIADLNDAPQIPSERFDCIIFTQTLHLIYNLKAALATLHRILKPGGILLTTVPGISQIAREPGYAEADSWRFTTSSVQRLFTEFFAETAVHVQSYGNVLAASAFLYGLAVHELETNELDYHDRDYPVIISVRAQKGDAVA